MRNNINNYKSFISIFITLLLLFSCGNFVEKNEFYTLYYSPENSTKEKSSGWDSLLIRNYKNDSIIINHYFRNKNYYQRFYFYKDGSFYERREVSNIHTEYYSRDTLLIFSKKDTVYKYQSKRDDFFVTIFDFALYNGKYIIKRDSDIYISKMQSIKDKNYSEFYYYDENYQINKFVYTFYSDTSVYLRKNYKDEKEF